MNPEDVPAGSVALDTDVFSLIHLKKGRHEEFARLLVGHDPFALSFAVVGELKVLPLRTKPPWGIKRREELEAAITRCVVLPATAAVVDEWARLSARFLDKLKGHGINDMWTAACCLVHGLPLATNNLSDFQTIAAEFPLRLVHPEL